MGVVKNLFSYGKDITGIVVGITTGDVPKVIKSTVGLLQDMTTTAENIADALFTPYVYVPGVGDVFSRPSVAVSSNMTNCFYQGGGSSGEFDEGGLLCCITSTDSLATQSVAIIAAEGVVWYAPSAVLFNGQVYVFYQGNSGNLNYVVYNGSSWGGVMTLSSDVLGAPMLADTSPSAFVFTPSGSSAPQIGVAYTCNVTSGGTAGYMMATITSANGSSWSSASVISAGNEYAIGPVGAAPGCSPSAVVYTPPGGSQTIYVFYAAPSSTNPVVAAAYLPVSAVPTGGIYSSMGTIATSGITGNPGAVVATPSGSTNPVIYLFHQGGYQNGQVWYTTYNGKGWTADTQVPNASISGGSSPAAAVLPPEAFFGDMEATTDIYIAAPFYNNVVMGGTLTVGGLSQYESGTAPSQVVNYSQYSGPSTCALLPVSFPGNANPQVWAIGQWSSPTAQQLVYAVYTQSGWVSYMIPTLAPAGSPSVALNPQGGQPCMVFNTASGSIAFASFDQTSYTWQTPVSTNFQGSGSPALVAFNNLLYLFYAGTSNQTVYCATSSNGGQTWSASSAVSNGLLTGSPSAVVFNGSLYVFYQGCNSAGGIWYDSLASTSGASWTGSTALHPQGISGAYMTGSPTACAYTDAAGNAQLTVFYAGIGTSGAWPLEGSVLGSDGTWSPFQVPGVFISEPAPYAYISPGATSLNVFYQPAASSQTGAAPGQLWYSVYNGSSWQDQAPFPVSTITGAASAITYQVARQPAPSVLIFYNSNSTGAAGGQICMFECTPPMVFTAQNIGLPTAGAPAATVINGSTYVFYDYQEGAQNTGLFNNQSSGILAYQQMDTPQLSPALALMTAPTWSATVPVPAPEGISGYYMTNSPSVAILSDSVYVFYCGVSGQLMCSTAPADLSAWSSSQILSITMDGACSPSAVTYNGMIYVFYIVSGGSPLAYITSTDGTNWTGPLPTQIVTTSEGPATFVYNNTLNLMYQGGDSKGNATGEYFWTSYSGSGTPTTAQIAGLTVCNAPSMVIFNGVLWCISQGSGGQNLWYDLSPSGKSWTFNISINNAIISSTSSPSATVFPPQDLADSSSTSQLYIAYQNNGQLWYLTTSGSSVPSTTPTQLVPSGCTSSSAITQNSPAILSFPPLSSLTAAAQLYVFYNNAGSPGQLCYTTQSSFGWSAPVQVTTSGTSTPVSGDVSAVALTSTSSSPQLYVFYQGQVGSGQSIPLCYSTYNNGSWTQGQVCTGIAGGMAPQAIVFNNVLYVFYCSPSAPTSSMGLAFSTLDGAQWSSSTFPNVFGTSNVASYPVPVVLNGTLYVYFQNAKSAGTLWVTSTTNGATWAAAVPAAEPTLVTQPSWVQTAQEVQKVVSDSSSIVDKIGSAVFGDDDSDE